VLTDPTGYPAWVSEVEPGSTHDITAARIHGLGGLYPAAIRGLPTLTDKGYLGAGIGIQVPTKGHNLHPDHQTRNALISALPAPAERANALFKRTWKALERVTLEPWRIGAITAAALSGGRGAPDACRHHPIAPALGPAGREGRSTSSPRRWANRQPGFPASGQAVAKQSGGAGRPDAVEFLSRLPELGRSRPAPDRARAALPSTYRAGPSACCAWPRATDISPLGTTGKSGRAGG